MRRKIVKVLDEIRPYLQSDGGDVVFIDFADNTVTLQLVGACAGCPSSTATLRGGIERRLKEALPDIHHVQTLQ